MRNVLVVPDEHDHENGAEIKTIIGIIIGPLLTLSIAGAADKIRFSGGGITPGLPLRKTEVLR